MIAVLVLLVVGMVSGNIICPDGTECQDKNTCCLTKTGYACCQYPSAVCCSDKAHCCPQGYQCNLETHLCEKKGLQWYKIPFSPQLPADRKKTASAALMKSDNPIDSLVHCDNTSFCPDGTTCCKSPQGQWYCCPYNMDLCCQSKTGCCPVGFRCDEASKTCVREFESPPKAIRPQDGVIHCSDKFYCPAGNSCCKTLTGQLACCPYPLGQCCKDGKHCCQYGYDCDSTFTKCRNRYSSVPALLTKEALFH